MRILTSITALVIAAASSLAVAQEPAAPEEPLEGQPEHGLRILEGPAVGALGTIANLDVPEGYAFVDKSQMPLFNSLTGNLDNPNDVGAIIADAGWLVFFSWDAVGYVKDDDKDELNAKKLMKTFLENEKGANKERQRLGMAPLFIRGWQTPPYYDAATNNLTWSIKNQLGEEGAFNFNHDVRLLGRRGVLQVTLVSSPEHFEGAVEVLPKLLSSIRFSDGEGYADFRQGDKIAQYGLAGLVLGGGALVAAKTGLLSQLGKFIKFIVLGAVAAVAGLFKFIRGRFSGQ